MPMSTKVLMAALVPVSEPEIPEPQGESEARTQSPVAGDPLFYTYCVPGAVIQAKDGTIWDLENIADTGFVRIRNKWYPRQERTLTQAALRKFIAAWIEPVQVTVPDLAE